MSGPYEQIAQIIRHLDENFTEQPDLLQLAKRAGLSESHFHRIFSRWVGITPKDFLQCLTLQYVKGLLRSGASVLEATLDSGLSSPGRTHDLCVNLESASPGEIKSGGEGLQITMGITDSPFGKCLIAENERGICHLTFSDAKNGIGDIKREWPNATIRRDDKTIKSLSRHIFRNTKNPRILNTYVKGTEFQIKVWRALLQTGPGTLVTYQDLANKIGRSGAVRAVGSAVGQNIVAYLIPCHRVIRSTGVIGNYRWGNARKRAMIAWETVKDRP